MSVVHNHSPALALLSVVIAVLAAYACLTLVERSHRRDQQRRGWLALATLIFGGGVWAMHFTGMLALELPFAVSYDITLSVASLLLVWLFTALGLLLGRNWRHPASLPLSGLLMGAGIASMHYTGMAALQMPATLVYLPSSIVAAVFVGAVASGLALRVALHPGFHREVQRHRWLSALFGGLAVSGLHYVAMAGTEVHPTALSAVIGGFSPDVLAGVVAAGALALVAIAVVVAKLDEGREHSEVLQASLATLRLRQQLLTGDRQVAELEISADGRLLHVGEAARELLRLGEAQPSHVLALVEPGAREDLRRRWLEARDRGSFEEVVPFLVDGRACPLAVQAAVLEETSGERWLVLLRRPRGDGDAALQDPETGLPNRLAVLALRVQQPALAVRIGLPVLEALSALLAPELYRRLLIELVQMVHSVVDTDDLLVLARPGSAELLLLTRAHGDAEALLARLRRVLSLPVLLDGQSWHVAAQLGVAHVAAGAGGDEVLRNTAAALRRAQREQLAVHVYDATFDGQWQRQILMEQQLRPALAERRFSLHYQPKLDLQLGRVCGVEALLRWQPAGEAPPPSPAEFIPLLESTGLIQEVGRWVIDESLRCLAELRQHPGLEELTMAINVSPVQLRSGDVLGQLEQSRRALGLAAQTIELEITEGIAMDRSRDNLARLRALSDAGYHLAIDDFGTGYSSLAYLRDFPMHSLKIDRAFVRDLEEDAAARDLVRLMVDIGHTLDYLLVAEGVETEAQLAHMRGLGVDQVQGYWLSPPVPASALPSLVRDLACRQVAGS